MDSKIHFSKATDEWATPQKTFDELHKEFNFTLDPCCTHESAKTIRHFTMEDDGLSQNWQRNSVFMNPPYSACKIWMEKAYKSSLEGATVVCLVPSRTDTKWWHEWAARGEVRFIKGRLKFGDSKNSAPFPSAIIIFRN